MENENSKKFVTKNGDVVEFLFVSDLKESFGFSETKLRKSIAEDGFPTPFFIGKKRFWVKDEIENYLERKMAEK